MSSEFDRAFDTLLQQLQIREKQSLAIDAVRKLLPSTTEVKKQRIVPKDNFFIAVVQSLDQLQQQHNSQNQQLLLAQKQLEEDARRATTQITKFKQGVLGICRQLGIKEEINDLQRLAAIFTEKFSQLSSEAGPEFQKDFNKTGGAQLGIKIMQENLLRQRERADALEKELSAMKEHHLEKQNKLEKIPTAVFQEKDALIAQLQQENTQLKQQVLDLPLTDESSRLEQSGSIRFSSVLVEVNSLKADKQRLIGQVDQLESELAKLKQGGILLTQSGAERQDIAAFVADGERADYENQIQSLRENCTELTQQLKMTMAENRRLEDETMALQLQAGAESTVQLQKYEPLTQKLYNIITLKGQQVIAVSKVAATQQKLATMYHNVYEHVMKELNQTIEREQQLQQQNQMFGQKQQKHQTEKQELLAEMDSLNAHIAQQQNQNSELSTITHQMKQIQAENTQLITQLNDKDAHAQQLEQKIQLLEQQVKQLTTISSKSRDDNSHLQQQINELTQQLQTATECATQFQRSLGEVQVELQQSQAESEHFQSATLEKTAQISELNKKIQVETQRKQQVMDDIAELNEQFTQVQQRSSETEQQLQELQTQLQQSEEDGAAQLLQLKLDLSKLQKNLANEKENTKKLQDELSATRQNEQITAQKLLKLTREKNAAALENAVLSQRVEEMEETLQHSLNESINSNVKSPVAPSFTSQQIVKQSDEAKRLQIEVNDLQSQIIQLEREKAHISKQYQAEITVLKQQLQQAKKPEQKLESLQVIELQSQKRILEQEVQKLTQQQGLEAERLEADRYTIKSKLGAELDVVNEKVKLRDEQLMQTKADMLEAKLKLKEMQLAYDGLVGQMQNLKQQNQDLEEELNEKAREIEETATIQKRLKLDETLKSLENKDTEIRTLRLQLEVVKRDLEVAHQGRFAATEIGRIQREKQGIEQQNTELKLQIQSLEQQLTELRKQLSAMCEENKQKQIDHQIFSSAQLMSKLRPAHERIISPVELEDAKSETRAAHQKIKELQQLLMQKPEPITTLENASSINLSRKISNQQNELMAQIRKNCELEEQVGQLKSEVYALRRRGIDK